MTDDYRKGIAPFGPQEFVCWCQVRPRACALSCCADPLASLKQFPPEVAGKEYAETEGYERKKETPE